MRSLSVGVLLCSVGVLLAIGDPPYGFNTLLDFLHKGIDKAWPEYCTACLDVYDNVEAALPGESELASLIRSVRRLIPAKNI